MQSNNMNEASVYFNANWDKYKNTVQKNTLYHREMFMALNQFLVENMGDSVFTLVDVGCGDSSNIEPILLGKAIKKYIGIDAAADVLKMAASNLAHLDCEKEFFAEDMTTAIKRVSEPVDIIFTSYAVHHLSKQDKLDFIANCKDKLKPNGFLLMVDGVLEHKQTRNEWLDALESRFKLTNPDFTQDDLTDRMQHPRADDHPEEIEVFKNTAKVQGWKNFDVIVNKGICAFMLFNK